MMSRQASKALGAIVFTALLTPSKGVTQERQSIPEEVLVGPGLVLDEDGNERWPTPDDALRALRDPSILPPGVTRLGPAGSVLGQEYERRRPTELDALANALADVILTSEGFDMTDDRDEYDLQRGILSTLGSAASGGERGTPHPGSFDALIRVYETLVAEALADGGTDPVEELERRKGPGYGWRLKSALRWIFLADMVGRGANYVLAVVAATEPPNLEETWPMRPGSLWCEAADIVRFGDGPTEENPRRGELPAAALDDEAFYQLCGYH